MLGCKVGVASWEERDFGIGPEMINVVSINECINSVLLVGMWRGRL